MDSLYRDRLSFLRAAYSAAKLAGHLWPKFAACEAALESGFGHSALAHDDNNLFGMKQHKHPICGTCVLPTREFVGIQKEAAAGVKDGKLDGWITLSATWVKYPSWRECFVDRMATLERLAPYLPHYANALKAAYGEAFVNEVSASWATDRRRAEKVLVIYGEFKADLEAMA